LAFYQHFLTLEQLISEYFIFCCKQAPDWSTGQLHLCLCNVVFMSKMFISSW